MGFRVLGVLGLEGGLGFNVLGVLGLEGFGVQGSLVFLGFEGCGVQGSLVFLGFEGCEVQAFVFFFVFFRGDQAIVLAMAGKPCCREPFLKATSPRPQSTPESILAPGLKLHQSCSCRCPVLNHKLHSSSFFGGYLIRILNRNPKKELLRSLWATSMQPPFLLASQHLLWSPESS